jgi:hypothetical protein
MDSSYPTTSEKTNSIVEQPSLRALVEIAGGELRIYLSPIATWMRS